MTLQQAVALGGLLLGAVGSVLGVVNYLRDRARVVIRLAWDMTMVGGLSSDPSKKWGLVKVTNVGRRPILVSHVSIRFPRGSKQRVLLLKDSVAGTKLLERSAPGLSGRSSGFWRVHEGVEEGLRRNRGSEWEVLRVANTEVAAEAVLGRCLRPNTRVQRTRSWPSALRSPLTRRPLGGSRSCAACWPFS